MNIELVALDAHPVIEEEHLLFSTELYRGGTFETIRDDIAEISQLAFKESSHPIDDLENEFENWPTTLAVVLLYAEKQDGKKKVIGYSIAQDYQKMIARKSNRKFRGHSTQAYILEAAIHEQYQGRGLISKVNVAMDDELKKYRYRTLHRDANIDNGYADKLVKVYADRIIKTEDHTNPDGTHTRYIEMTL